MHFLFHHHFCIDSCPVSLTFSVLSHNSSRRANDNYICKMNLDSCETRAGYDIYTSQFNAEGRIFQIEYAQTAADMGGTMIGLRGNDGVVLAAENISAGKLYEPENNKRIYTIKKRIGVAATGIRADARSIIEVARGEAANFLVQYKEHIPISYLKDRIAMYMHAYTLYASFRPFGVNLIIGAYGNDKGPEMYHINAAGASQGYYGCAIGKAKDAAMTEMRKIDIHKLPISKLVRAAAKILHTIQDELDENIELELSWVGERTGGKHTLVPLLVQQDAENYAQTMFDDDNFEFL